MLDKLAKYYEYYNIKAPTEKFDVIQNPGAKTISSLIDKVKRNVEIQGRKNFTLNDISDMARCSVLFNSYSDIPPFLKGLKQRIPSLTGYISRFPSGYRGIHLNFEIDGITVEIQLSTQRAWEVKQLTENFYTKWRGFNLQQKNKEIIDLSNEIKDLEQKLTNSTNDENLKQNLEEKKLLLRNLKKDLKTSIDLQNAESKMTKDLYTELHSDGQFAVVEDEIESLLLSFEATKTISQEKEELKFLKETFSIDQNGNVNENEVRLRATNANSMAQSVQKNLIENVKQTLLVKNDNILVDDKINEGMKLIHKIINAYNENLQKVYQGKEENILDNINIISYQRYNIAVEVTKFALKHNLTKQDIPTLLYEFYNNVAKNPDQFSSKNLDFPNLDNYLKEELFLE